MVAADWRVVVGSPSAQEEAWELVVVAADWRVASPLARGLQMEGTRNEWAFANRVVVEWTFANRKGVVLENVVARVNIPPHPLSVGMVVVVGSQSLSLLPSHQASK